LSDHGKESRLPFLDEDLISFLNSIPIKYKCDMKQARGYGEKILLRKLAEERLNLKFAASLQKRAIQFGSRVAKIENCKEKASDVCNRLTNNLKIED
jgi:asparagine synthetase B (glutamine-hydrolysing)